MNSQFNKTKKIPLKHTKVLKSTTLSNKEPVVISPIKQFASPSKPQNTHVQSAAATADNDSSTSLSSAPTQTSSLQTAPEPSVQDSTLDIIQENSDKPDINSLDVMKRNINDEMQNYKKEQIALIQDELEQIKKDVSEQAYTDAVAQAKKVYEEKIQTLSTQSNELLTSINQLAETKKEDLFEKRELVTKLAVEMAEKIVKKQIKMDPSTFESLFAEAFEKITDKDNVCIEVNPDDLGAITEYKQKFESKFKAIEKLEIKETKDITRGGCTIETNLGYIDATLESKLELLFVGFQAFHTQFDDDQKQASKEANSTLQTTKETSSNAPSNAHTNSQANLEKPESKQVNENDFLDTKEVDTSDNTVSQDSTDSSSNTTSNSDDEFDFEDDFDFEDLDDDFDFDDDFE